MKQELFDNYRFSVRTEVNFFEDVWDRVTEVDFWKRKVGVERGQIVDFSDIKHLRESNL